MHLTTFFYIITNFCKKVKYCEGAQLVFKPLFRAVAAFAALRKKRKGVLHSGFCRKEVRAVTVSLYSTSPC